MAPRYPYANGVMPRVKACSRDADASDVTSARTLSLLAAFASPLVLCAAVAGWLYGLWPANPLTLGLAAFAVCSGPLLGIYHVATADEAYEDEELEVTQVLTPTPVVNVAEARARAFHNWRDKVNPVLERRERERRASRYLRA
jgi:hypothetical protein